MGWPQSVALQAELELGKLIAQTRVHTGLLWAVALAADACGRCFKYTVLGFDIRAVGANARAAAFAGVPVTRTVVLVALLSGALAGLAGAIEVAGRTGYVTLDMSPGYGYSGIVIAMLAGLHPLGVLAAGVFVAGVLVGADTHEPRDRRADLHRRRDRRRVADRGAGGDAADAIPGALEMSELLDILANAGVLGRGAAHRHAADLRHARRAAVRARRRAQPRHRRHHGRRRLHRLARGVRRRAACGRASAVAALTGAVFGLLHALLTVGLALSQHVSGLGITLLATALSYYGYRVSFPEGQHAADGHAVRADGVAAASRCSTRRRRSRCWRCCWCRCWRTCCYRTPAGPGAAHGRREPAGGRGPGRVGRGHAHRRDRGRLGADGRGRRVPHAVGLQRLLLQHGQRPRLDLRGAGRVRLLAARQGAARRAAVRLLRRAAAAPAAVGRRACCRTRCT